MTEQAEEQKKQAMICALRALAMGDKSEHDLQAKLSKKGFPEEAIRHVIGQLKQEGLLSDQVFAQKLANRVLNTKRSGSRKLAFELKKRRVPEAIQRSVLGSIDIEAQREQAYELAGQKLQTLKPADSRVWVKKLYDFLIGKGYDFQLAQEAARKAVTALGRQTENEND